MTSNEIKRIIVDTCRSEPDEVNRLACELMGGHVDWVANGFVFQERYWKRVSKRKALFGFVRVFSHCGLYAIVHTDVSDANILHIRIAKEIEC